MNKPNALSDKSLWALLAINIFAAILVIQSNSGITNMLWIFWFQSVIIGIFNVIKMISTNNYSTNGIKINGVELKGRGVSAAISEWGIKIYKFVLSIFFAIHYGGFQFGYFLFLTQIRQLLPLVSPNGPIPPAPNFSIIFTAAAAFLIYQTFSFFYNRKSESIDLLNIGEVMFSPYKRVWVMHLTLFAAVFLNQYGISIIVFLALKIIADLWSHSFTHNHYTAQVIGD